jgi:intergrase/recombinase
VNNKDFSRLMMYGAARSLSAELQARGLISEREAAQIDKACRKKYQQNLGAFCADKP